MNRINHIQTKKDNLEYRMFILYNGKGLIKKEAVPIDDKSKFQLKFNRRINIASYM